MSDHGESGFYCPECEAALWLEPERDSEPGDDASVHCWWCRAEVFVIFNPRDIDEDGTVRLWHVTRARCRHGLLDFDECEACDDPHADPRLVRSALEAAALVQDAPSAVAAIAAVTDDVDVRIDADRRRVGVAQSIATAAGATRLEICIAACLVGGLAGALDDATRGLVAVAALGDAGALEVLRDRVEELGLDTDLGAWLQPEQRRPWLPVEPHEHVWLEAFGEGANGQRGRMSLGPGGSAVQQCTCGVFEHEADRFGPHVRVRVDGEHRTHFYKGVKCPAPRCNMRGGHAPPHREILRVLGSGMEVAEWTDGLPVVRWLPQGR